MSTAVEALTSRAREAQDKARVLREALPWITRWAGRTVVVKYGGNAIGARASAGGNAIGSVSGAPGDVGETALDAGFAADVALLRSVGLRVVVVHGGGPQISALSQRFGLQARFVDGRRVTDGATLEVVKMVLLGQVNPYLVGLVSRAGAPAAGVAGTDAGLVVARASDPQLGFVGDVDTIDPSVVLELLDAGVVPVVATIARDAAGQELNVNADAVAGALAAALQADKLIVLTNVPGLYEDFGTADQALLSEIDAERLRELLESGALHTGMVPKVRSIVDALDAGVAQAHLLDGRVEHALLLEIFTDSGVGTMVTRGSA